VADSTHGWVVGRVGLWGLGLAAPAPRFLGTQPPCVTQMLTLAVILYVITIKHETQEYYMLFAGWEVRIVKNCDRDLENAGQHFQVRGHSFSLYGPTLSR